jgi:hypothetical protein
MEEPTWAYHHNSRSTKATLASISDRDSLLNRMGLLHIADSLNCDNMLTVNANQWSNTGVHRGMVDLLRGGVDMGNNLLSA